MVNEVEARGKGAVRMGWVKAHMGTFGNEAAKQAAEGVSPDDHGKWVSGGYQAVDQAGKDGVLRGVKGR